MRNRRSTLKTLAGGSALLPVLGQHQHEASSGGKLPPYTAKVFSAAELALLGELTGIIIPRTDTPGAADAGVPLLMDGTASRNTGFAAAWKKALGWLAAQSDKGEALVKRISQEKGTEGARVFKLLKDSTIDHYYATQAGLQKELGWNANTYLSEFKGCTHPEHQA